MSISQKAAWSQLRREKNMQIKDWNERSPNVSMVASEWWVVVAYSLFIYTFCTSFFLPLLI